MEENLVGLASQEGKRLTFELASVAPLVMSGKL